MKHVTIDISQVKSYVAANLSKIHSTHQMAAELGCSDAILCTRFHEAAGISLRRYIIQLRVCQMKDRLQDHSVLCKVVCLDAGMSEYSGARLFKHETGVTMQEFRNQGPNLRD